MTKKIYLLIAILVVAAMVGGFLYFKYKPTKQVACTMEAKLCSDGSYVGRTGPNCEFAPCPSEALCGGGKCPENGNEERGVIRGRVDIGPICPVERVGVPCPVPPEAYTSREVILYAADGMTIVKRMNFAPDGTYQFEAPAGVYVLDTLRQSIGGSKDLPKTLTVKPGQTLEVDFSIDTGIR